MYITDGVLPRGTLKDVDLGKYCVVVFDEAHERLLRTDVLSGILKKVVARRRDFKLIVTSATLNAQNFSNFFMEGLKKVRKVRSHRFKTLKTLKIQLTSCGPDCNIVRKAIRSDHFHNVARLKGVGEYVNYRKGMSCHMHPSSALYGLRDMPDYVLNHELIPTTKEYLKCVTSVEPRWLVELGHTNVIDPYVLIFKIIFPVCVV
ncbi:putative RNA helicase [Helianthus anomalus]